MMFTMIDRTEKKLRIIAAFSVLLILQMTFPALAQDPMEKLESGWLSISGKVISAGPNSFRLDYGKGDILVEMDDWDLRREGAELSGGEEVTVIGRIDNELYQTKTIEASAVYVKNLNSYFYASAKDEEGWLRTYTDSPAMSAFSYIELVGNITDITERQFTVSTGAREIRIDTAQMTYNPLDEYGFQQLQIGDRVRVSGKLNDAVFSERKLIADTITTLISASAK